MTRSARPWPRASNAAVEPRDEALSKQSGTTCRSPGHKERRLAVQHAGYGAGSGRCRCGSDTHGLEGGHRGQLGLIGSPRSGWRELNVSGACYKLHIVVPSITLLDIPRMLGLLPLYIDETWHLQFRPNTLARNGSGQRELRCQRWKGDGMHGIQDEEPKYFDRELQGLQASGCCSFDRSGTCWEPPINSDFLRDVYLLS